MSLLFLVLLTLIGVTSMNTGILQERMAGNMRDLDIALQAAETSLRYGESQLSALDPEMLCSTPPVTAAVPDTNGIVGAGTVDYDNASWWATWGVLLEQDAVQQVAEASEDPRHAIEWLARGKSKAQDASNLNQDAYGRLPSYPMYYRISARGVGRTPAAQVVLRNTHKVLCN